ncbi:hypothetical protein ACH5AU_19520 [Streptomyces albidoflavus]
MHSVTQMSASAPTLSGFWTVASSTQHSVPTGSAKSANDKRSSVWRQAKAALDSEHTRRAIGETQVPYGTCTEPSKVAAGAVLTARSGSGASAAATFAPTCLTCERLAAFTDADDWAKGDAMPSDDEIAVSSTVTVTCSNEFTPPPTHRFRRVDWLP